LAVLFGSQPFQFDIFCPQRLDLLGFRGKLVLVSLPRCGQFALRFTQLLLGDQQGLFRLPAPLLHWMGVEGFESVLQRYRTTAVKIKVFAQTFAALLFLEKFALQMGADARDVPSLVQQTKRFRHDGNLAHGSQQGAHALPFRV
jgi:hypothetical protein